MNIFNVISLFYLFQHSVILLICWGVPYRWTCPHVTYTNWALFCAVSVAVAVLFLSQSSLSEPLPRAVIFLIVKLRRGFSLLSFVYVLFAFNIFLITYFCVVSSFEPPLDHNIIGFFLFFAIKITYTLIFSLIKIFYMPPFLITEFFLYKSILFYL